MQKDKMKVLYIVNVPAPYMVNYFNELGKHCDLTVIFEKDRSTERDRSWRDFEFKNFKGIILRGISTDVDMACCPQVVFCLKKNRYDFIIITSMTTPTGIIAIEYLKMRKIPFILESEGGFAKNGKGFKEKFKKHIMSGAEWYFSTSKLGDEYFLMYGATKEKLVKYPFTSLYKDDLLTEIVSDEKKERLRKELEMKEEKIVVTVGRFTHIKGFDVLLNAAELLDENVGIYFIGGVPTEEYLQIVEDKKLSNVHFVGFKSKDELNKYYDAADVFVLPTREDTWGLVIAEAMARALPVITTDKCVAGVELVKDDENGYIVPVEEAKSLSEKIENVLSDEERRKEFGRKSIRKIQWYTFESMVKVHMDFLEAISW